MEQGLSFTCLRPHTFFNKNYYLKVTDTQVLISAHSDYRDPKYRIDINYQSQLLWKLTNTNQLKAFGIFYQHRIKYFESTQQNLLALKETLAGRVVYRNLASFYEPLELIGEGLSAQVFKSRGILTNEVFAIKMIKKDFSEDERALQVVQNEVVILRQLKHKNVIKVIELYENDNTCWIVQEFVSGVPLVDILKKHKLSKHQTRSILMELMETIEYLQSQGIVHMDIKPDNIIVTNEQLTKIKLIDFGFASHINKKSMGICGTPGYYAPELLRFKEHSINTDMFSAGVVFYNLLTSQPCHKLQFKYLVQTLEQANKQQFDEDAQDLLRRMLEQNPVDRIQAKEALCHAFFDDFAFPLQSIEEGERNDCEKSVKTLKTQKTKSN